MAAIKTLFNLRWLTLIVALAFCLGSEEARAESVLYGVAHNGKVGPSTLYKIDPVTGVATPVGPIMIDVDGTPTEVAKISGMDADPSGRLYATGEFNKKHTLLVIDPATGAGTEVAPTGLKSKEIPELKEFKTATDISFSSGGTLYANFLKPAVQPTFLTNIYQAEALGSINPLTGKATVLGSTVTDKGNALAFSEDDILFKAGTMLYILNVGTGEKTFSVGLTFPPLEGASGEPRINAMDVEPETGLLFVSVNAGFSGSGPNYLATIDLATIDTDPVNVNLVGLGPTVTGLDAIAFVSIINDAAPSPNPSSSYSYLKCNPVARGRYIRNHQEVEVVMNDGSESKKVRVMNPVSLCTPVNLDGEELTDSASSLTCYRVKEFMRHRRSKHYRSFEWHHVYIENEFGEQTLSVIQPETLCVPSEIKEDKVKIKTHYHKRDRHSKDHKKHRRTKKHKKDNDDDDDDDD